MADEQAIW